MKKNRYWILKNIFVILISVIVPGVIEKFYYNTQPFLTDRFIIIMFFMLFIGIHFIFDIKKIWIQIYKKRYLIGIIIFAFLVINCYHGSSVGIYNGAIQGEYQVENGNPILGENRVIRGDEYAVATPFTLSQMSEANNMDSTNHNLMAQDKSVSFYLRYPTIDTASIAVPQQLFFAVLPLENAFSAYWYFPIFFMFFSTFELMMILLKKNKKWALIGALMITFSPAAQWWSSFMIIASGSAAIVSFNKFLETEQKKNKIIYAALIGLFGSMYIMNMYPAWLIPYGYFFFVLVCWLIYKHRESIKIKDLIMLCLIAILVIGFIIIPSFINGRDTYNLITNTVYPGARLSTGGSGYKEIIKYMTNVFLPFKTVANESEMSQFISFYPLPTIMGLYYCYKNKKERKKDFLLGGLVILSILLSIWNFVELPEIVVKITLLFMSTVNRADIVLGFVNVVILIICLSNYTRYTIKSWKSILIIAIVALVFIIINVNYLSGIYTDYFNKKIMFILTITGFFVAFVLIALNNKKLNNVLMVGLIATTILSGMTVHPLNKGLKVFYDKPVIKEIQEIVADEPKARWISVGTPYFLQNYVTVTGVYMINSTNYFPNFDFWNVVDKERKYDEIYNRYAHLTINLTNEESSASLLSGDHVSLNLQIDKLKELNVSYILTVQDLSNLENELVDFEQIYNEYGIFIYKVS